MYNALEYSSVSGSASFSTPMEILLTLSLCRVFTEFRSSVNLKEPFKDASVGTGSRQWQTEMLRKGCTSPVVAWDIAWHCKHPPYSYCSEVCLCHRSARMLLPRHSGCIHQQQGEGASSVHSWHGSPVRAEHIGPAGGEVETPHSGWLESGPPSPHSSYCHAGP